MFRFFKVAAVSAVLATVAFVANATTFQGSTLAGGAGGIGLENAADNGSIYALDPNDYPIVNGPYFNGSTDPASAWVWAAPESPMLSQALRFVFRFTLTAQEAASATLSGLWGVDNEGIVALNGSIIDQLAGDVSSSFAQLHTLSAGSSLFHAGENVLSFDVNNIGGDPSLWNPAALRASVTVVAPVPVPAALPLLGGAVMVLGFVGSRRKRSA